MIQREAEEKLRTLANGFPAVSVTGPRQSGKTTLVKAVFPELPYVLLEDLDTRAYAKQDPRSFLKQYETSGAIIDEVQHVPELFSYLQGFLDTAPKARKFILTGSQNFMLSEKLKLRRIHAGSGFTSNRVASLIRVTGFTSNGGASLLRKGVIRIHSRIARIIKGEAIRDTLLIFKHEKPGLCDSRDIFGLVRVDAYYPLEKFFIN